MNDAQSMSRVRVIRPHEVDHLHFPTMRELAEAERAALLRGDYRRARAYRLVRARRVARAQGRA